MTAHSSVAAVFTAPRKVELQEFPLPDTGDDDGLLAVAAVGICGSDWAQFKGKLGMPGPVFPIIPGHEIVGRIHRAGTRAQRNWGVKEGDLVAVEEVLRCGSCHGCASASGSCSHLRLYGLNVPTTIAPALWGGYAQYMYLHPNTAMHRVPDGVRPEHAALFVPLANGIRWAQHVARPRLGDVAVVQGPGQQGLGCVVALREAGAGMIIVTGTGADAYRLALARDLGADATIDVDDENALERVRSLTAGRLADLVIDVSSGATAPVAAAVDMVRPKGMIILAGLKDGASVALASDRIVLKQLTLQGVGGHDSASVAAALRLIASGRYPLEKLCTHTLPLSEAERALALVGRRVTGEEAVHVTLVPPTVSSPGSEKS
jgi:2-desacetyl-2-hydroxyethyl bacteriochlorophyllide A dehydrogenase